MGLIVRDNGVLKENNAIVFNFLDGISVTENSAGNVSIFVPDNGIISTMIADNAIGSAQIADGSVGTTKIADNSITGIKIQNAQVTPAKLDRTYLVPTDLVKPAMLKNDDWNNAGANTTINSGNNTILSNTLITIPNDTEYDLEVVAYALVQPAANTNIATLRARIADSGGTVIIDQPTQFDRNAWIGLWSRTTLLGRRNEQIRAQTFLSALGGGSIVWRMYACSFRGFPR
jgi:hypothetical protein